jgi:hypothetical protein
MPANLWRATIENGEELWDKTITTTGMNIMRMQQPAPFHGVPAAARCTGRKGRPPAAGGGMLRAANRVPAITGRRVANTASGPGDKRMRFPAGYILSSKCMMPPATRVPARMGRGW